MYVRQYRTIKRVADGQEQNEKQVKASLLAYITTDDFLYEIKSIILLFLVFILNAPVSFYHIWNIVMHCVQGAY